MILDAVIYDIEIEKCIPDRRVPPEPDLRYCQGWDDHANMGIAVLCAYDTRDSRYRVFLKDNLDRFAALIQGRLVVGFNTHGFDNQLLDANGIQVLQDRSWDLLCALRKACGEPETYTRGVTAAGRTLDALAACNLGASKTGHGELAPVNWQRGKWGTVIDYCLADVNLTVRLCERLPLLQDPVTRRLVTLELPAFAPVIA